MSTEHTITRLTLIKEQVAGLKKSDKKLKFFGAKQHQYTFNPVISTDELEAFEQAHHISLPEEYRSFITQIGNGGAGPYYGVRPLASYHVHYIHHGASHAETHLSSLFPAHYWLKEGETLISPEMIRESVNGTVSICEEGDGYNHLLIVSGEERGNIWFDGSVSDQGMAPFSTEEKQRYTFLDWYESWLEMARS